VAGPARSAAVRACRSKLDCQLIDIPLGGEIGGANAHNGATMARRGLARRG
jgi:hypothetical protein